MADPTAKIVEAGQVVNGNLADFISQKASTPAFSSYLVEIEHNGVKYTRRFTFVLDDHFVHHIGGPITDDDVKRAILIEADKIRSMHDVAASLSQQTAVDLVAALK